MNLEKDELATLGIMHIMKSGSFMWKNLKIHQQSG